MTELAACCLWDHLSQKNDELTEHRSREVSPKRNKTCYDVASLARWLFIAPSKAWVEMKFQDELSPSHSKILVFLVPPWICLPFGFNLLFFRFPAYLIYNYFQGKMSWIFSNHFEIMCVTSSCELKYYRIISIIKKKKKKH